MVFIWNTIRDYFILLLMLKDKLFKEMAKILFINLVSGVEV